MRHALCRRIKPGVGINPARQRIVDDEIERIQKEAEAASKKANFKAPAIDFSKLGAITDDDDSDEEDSDDDEDDDNEESFEDFNMDDLM